MDRLGLASLQGADRGGRVAIDRGHDARAPGRRCRTRRTSPASRAAALAGRRRRPRLGDLARGCRSSTAATRRAPTASSRSAAVRSAAARSTTSSTRRARWPRPATARSRYSARTSTRTGTTWRPRRGSRMSTPERWAGRRLDLHGRPDLAELIRAIDGLRTADGRPAIPRLRFVTSHPWDLSDRLIAAMADCPSRVRGAPSAGPVGRRRDAPPDGPPVHDRALPRAARADPRGRPGHRALDRRHRRVLRRDRGPVRGHAAAARDGPLRPGLRGRLLASDPARPRRTSPTTCPPPRSAAGSTSCCALQEAIGLERNRAWVGRDDRGPRRPRGRAAEPRPRRRRGRGLPRSRATRSPTCRRASRTCRAEPARTSSSTSPATRRSLASSCACGSSTPGRTRCAGRSSERGSGRSDAPLAPLIVIAGPTATGKTGLASRSRRRSSGPRGRPRSSRLIRARCIAGSTSGRRRSTAEERARVVHHGLDLVEPDEPFSVADFRAHALEVLRRSRRPRRDRPPGRRDRPLASRGRARPRHGRAPVRRRRYERRSRTDSPATGWRPLVADLSARAPSLAATRGPRQPAPRRPGTRDRDAPGRRPAARAPRLSRPGRVARPRPRRSRRARPVDRRPRAPAVRCRPDR